MVHKKWKLNESLDFAASENRLLTHEVLRCAASHQIGCVGAGAVIGEPEAMAFMLRLTGCIPRRHSMLGSNTCYHPAVGFLRKKPPLDIATCPSLALVRCRDM